MSGLLHGFVHVVMMLFAIGAAGCLVVIPVVAFRFFSVLMERDPAEPVATSGSR